MIKYLLTFSGLIILLNGAVFSQNQTCASAIQFCAGDTLPNVSGGVQAETGPSYGCLSTQPNPAWFYFTCISSGSIELTISQFTTAGTGLDVDFALWGPFNSPVGNCSNLISGNIIDCSYSTANVEVATIPSAIAGQTYMLLVTNYDGSPGDITFDQTSGTGLIDCYVQNVCRADAGVDTTICVGGSILLGASPAGLGSGNITYNWTSSNNLNDSTLANPLASPLLNEIYYLTITDDTGCVAMDSVMIFVDPCTNVNEFIVENNFSIFPNPTTGEFTITKPSGIKEKLNIRLYSLEGKLVYEGIINENESSKNINVSENNNGLYYLQLIFNDKVLVKKILKN